MKKFLSIIIIALLAISCSASKETASPITPTEKVEQVLYYPAPPATPAIIGQLWAENKPAHGDGYYLEIHVTPASCIWQHDLSETLRNGSPYASIWFPKKPGKQAINDAFQYAVKVEKGCKAFWSQAANNR